MPDLCGNIIPSLRMAGERCSRLVGFTSRPNESVSLAVARPCRGVAMYVIGTEAPTVLDAVKVDGQMELHLPAFSYYAGLEFRS